MRRQTVNYKDVYFIIAIMVAAEMIVLIAFQIVSPHVWQRDVIVDMGGYSIESIGSCNSDVGWWFFATLVSMNVICLFVALILCWKIKDIPSDFAESNYIFLSVMFMFQILLLAVPVSAMVRDDNNVFFFIRVAAVFMQNFTVLVLIFVPKIRRIHMGEDTAASVRNSMLVSISNMSGAAGVRESASSKVFRIRETSRTGSGQWRNSRIGSQNGSQSSVASIARSTDSANGSKSLSGPFPKDPEDNNSEPFGKSKKDTDEENNEVAVDEENGATKQSMKKRVSWTDSGNNAISIPIDMVDFPDVDL